MASNSQSITTHPILAQAKVYYSDKKYSKAAVLFKQVSSSLIATPTSTRLTFDNGQIATSCPCGVKPRLSPCLCKSLVRAIEHGTLEDELKKKCICSAKSDVRCKNVYHVGALDGLAAIHEVKVDYDVAVVNAEAMINLAPREPKVGASRY